MAPQGYASPPRRRLTKYEAKYAAVEEIAIKSAKRKTRNAIPGVSARSLAWPRQIAKVSFPGPEGVEDGIKPQQSGSICDELSDDQAMELESIERFARHGEVEMRGTDEEDNRQRCVPLNYARFEENSTFEAEDEYEGATKPKKRSQRRSRKRKTTPAYKKHTIRSNYENSTDGDDDAPSTKSRAKLARRHERRRTSRNHKTLHEMAVLYYLDGEAAPFPNPMICELCHWTGKPKLGEQKNCWREPANYFEKFR